MGNRDPTPDTLCLDALLYGDTRASPMIHGHPLYNPLSCCVAGSRLCPTHKADDR